MNNKLFYKKFFSKNWKYIIYVLIFVNISGFCRMTGAKYIEYITDTIRGSSINALAGLIGVAVIFQAFSYLTKWLSSITGKYTGEKFALELRVTLFEHLTRLEYKVLETLKSGDLQSTLRNDIDIASRMMQLFALMATHFFSLLYCVWYLATINLGAAVTVVTAGVVFGFLNSRVLTVIKKYDSLSRKSFGNLTHGIINAYEGVDIVKTYNGNDYVKRVFNKEREEYNRQTLNSVKTDTARLFIYNLVNNASLYGCAIFLCYKAINGELSLSEVVVFIALLRQVLSPIEVIFRQTANVMGCFAAMDRAGKIFGLKTDPDIGTYEADENEKSTLGSIESIEFKNINFSYDADGKNGKLFDNYLLSMQKGNGYLLAGQSGSGKTTLIKILLGLYKTDMEVTVSGKKQSAAKIRDLASYVSSDNMLFNMSIYDNITFGDTNITYADCERLSKELGVYEWIMSLPDKFDTVINENGKNLSGGQKQSICIMRAMLLRRPLIIMDEPFASLDKEKEGILTNVFERLKKQNDILLITSHRENASKGFNVINI